VGKSALATQLRSTVMGEAGFFIGGKFDQQQQGDEPYTAFTMACRELCDVLFAHKENPSFHGNQWKFTFDEIQAKLKEELSTDNNELEVLTTVFPDLLQIVGGDFLTQPSQSFLGYSEAKNHFNYAFRRLMRVICSFGRVVLFLDDLQWGDAASMELIRTIITDSIGMTEENVGEGGALDNNKDHGHGLVVLATYRSDQVDESHILTRMVQELEDFGAVDSSPSKKQKNAVSFFLHRIAIGNLDLDQVNEMLFDLLNANVPKDTILLAKCVHDKTQGNIFYVIQFIKALSSSDQSLLTFDVRSMKWVWDVDRIKVRASATTNVVEMIQQRMDTLPGRIRNLLTILACFGASFEYSVVVRVLDHFLQQSDKDVVMDKASIDDLDKTIFDSAGLISMFEKEGLLVHDTGQGKVKWDHDKIQEAALSIADGKELSSSLQDWRASP
jgi:predicted ATPase